MVYKKISEAKMENNNRKQVEIWAIGGGKGGTGKTFVLSQLAYCLASRGKRIILIDTDFGGANLHTFFGLKRTSTTIMDFFEKKESLENLVHETPVENLSIIPGNISSVSPANINHSQKIKLFRHIQRLEADYILLDLGGGTSVDTIDAFLLADRLIVVAVPEVTSIENLYQFIKSVYFRKLKNLFSEYGLKNRARDIWIEREKYGIKGIVDLLDYLKTEYRDMDDLLSQQLSTFTVYIILNKVRNVREVLEGFSVKSICIKYIGVDARYSGYIEYDYQFWRHLSLIQTTPGVSVSYSIRSDVMKIANNVISGDQMRIDSLKNV
jgi:flagellar biosynthesis protein FlhG